MGTDRYHGIPEEDRCKTCGGIGEMREWSAMMDGTKLRKRIFRCGTCGGSGVDPRRQPGGPTQPLTEEMLKEAFRATLGKQPDKLPAALAGPGTITIGSTSFEVTDVQINLEHQFFAPAKMPAQEWCEPPLRTWTAEADEGMLRRVILDGAKPKREPPKAMY